MRRRGISNRQSKRVRVLRAGTPLVLAAFVASQAAAFAHQVLVRHATCVEHGEVVDVGEVDEALPAGLPERTSARPANEADEDHAHGHCLALAQRREQFGLTAFQHSVGPVTAEHDATSPGADELPRAACAVYRLAPKNSPPV